MKHHYITEDLFQALEAGKWNEVLKLVLEDETISILFRDKKIDAYYRGHKCFTVDMDKITFNTQFGNRYEKYDFKSVITTEELIHNIPFCKQNIDFWFGKKKNPYEREFEQLIFRENNSRKLGNVTDYFILDMEYQYKNNGKFPEPDLVAVKIERTERGAKKKNKERKIAFIEVKYGTDAYNGKAGISTHIRDYVDLVNNNSVLDAIKVDLTRMFTQRKQLGMLQGLKDKSMNIILSDEKPELIFALIGYNTNSGSKGRGKDLKTILAEALEEYGREALDSVYIARTSEMGFGLYADKILKIEDYIKE